MSSHESPIIIVKKHRGGHHDDHHGGSWKIAFADFAIAMMALFMVLWIVGSSTKEERMEIQQRINSPDLFELTNSPYAVDFGGRASPLETYIQAASDEIEDTSSDTSNEQADLDSIKDALESERPLDGTQLLIIADVIKDLAAELNMSENLVIEVVAQGLRILVQDSENRAMFTRGSAVITPFFEDILFQLTPVLSTINNRLVISGHTDSTGFRRSSLGNWNLSSQRALVAYQFMVDSGLPEKNVLQVASMADRVLVDADNPTSGKNRRIELMILTQEADRQLETLFGSNEPVSMDSSLMQQATEYAEENQPVTRLDVMMK